MSTRSTSLSRRKFMATSLGTAMGVAALGIVSDPVSSVHAEYHSPVVDPDDLLASVEQIAPLGRVQDRVRGADADQLAQIPLTAMHAQYTMLVGGTSLSTSTPHIAAAPTFRETIEQEITARMMGIAEDGMRYTDYTVEAQIEGVWANQDTATVIWTEKVGLRFGGESDPRVPPQFFEIKTHLTALERDGSTWLIVDDNPSFGYRSTPNFPVGADPSNTSSPDTTRKVTPVTRSFQRTIPSEEMLLGGSYSREQAARYAADKAYVDDGTGSGQTGYHDFGYNCTNFVSQCMRAGGWQDVNGWYQSDSVWWYSGFLWPVASWTWAGAENLYWFLWNSGRASRIYTSVYDLWFGDIIQYDWTYNYNIDHTQICHHRSSSGRIYMAQHTPGYAWKPLSDVLAGKHWWCYAWRMQITF